MARSRVNPEHLRIAYNEWIRGAYEYEVLGESFLSDAQWDARGKFLSKNWSRLEHPDKHLTTKTSLHTAHHLNGKWPSWVVNGKVAPDAA
jgi:hypothetical protein